MIVHAVTVKGFGYQPAIDDEADCLHSVGVIDPLTGKAMTAGAQSWTNVLSDEMVAVGGERPDVVALTAAMLQPVGLHAFSQAYPGAGLRRGHRRAARGHLRGRARRSAGCTRSSASTRRSSTGRSTRRSWTWRCTQLPVTFVLDRAGITGEDGASHNGMWDLSLLQLVPGIRIAAPRDARSLREELREALAVDDGPTVVRFPKGAVGDDIPAVGSPRPRRRAACAASTQGRPARRRRRDGPARASRSPSASPPTGSG